MKIIKQYSFFKNQSASFGGSLLFGKRKEKRPLSTKKPMHLILKSEKASAQLSFVNHRRIIENIFYKLSTRYGVKVAKLAVNFNHIHVVIHFKSIHSYKSWIRHLTAEMVREISRRTQSLLKGFFTHRPFTRILEWGKDYRNALDYLDLNLMEVVGMRPEKAAKNSKSIKTTSSLRDW